MRRMNAAEAAQLLRDGDTLLIGGSGGGRPDMAQAGGALVDKIDEALSSFYSAIS